MLAGKPLWSEIYAWWDDKPEILSLAASYPVYEGGELVGVFSVDFIVSQIKGFLNSLKSSEAGRIFIMERSVLLVANSGAARAFRVAEGQAQRLPAQASPDPLIRAIAHDLLTQFADFHTLAGPQQLNLRFEGETHFLQATPYQDDLGLNWLIIVAVPEAEFMAQIHANTRATWALCWWPWRSPLAWASLPPAGLCHRSCA